MRRIFIFILSALLVLLLNGCVNSKTGSSLDNSSEIVTSAGSTGELNTEPLMTTSNNTGTSADTTNTKKPTAYVSTTSLKPNSASASTTASASIAPTKIVMTDKEITLDRDRTWTTKYTLTPANANRSGIKFTSSDTGVVTVSKTGVVTPVKTSKGGSATITAKLPNGFTATMKVNVIYHEPTDSETLKDALAKKGVSIPSFASSGKLGSGSVNEVTCEYAVWANGSDGKKYSNDASIDMDYNSTVTVTFTVYIKVNKAPDNGTISLKRDYNGKEQSETIKVKTGDLIQKTYTLTVQEGGSNKVYHLSLIRNPLNLSSLVYSIKCWNASASFT